MPDLKYVYEIRCSGRLSSSCSTSGSHRHFNNTNFGNCHIVNSYCPLHSNMFLISNMSQVLEVNILTLTNF